ncbi:hypothetical protein [Nocardia abscessus]|uniref:hypothetical protein n=1 Tax=Nocardia abscessus TaxID=120957 RepID=UPI0024571FB3|nr:hypothetical protein [Nocardia abscessus]
MKTIMGAVAAAITVSLAVAGCQSGSDTPATGTNQPSGGPVVIPFTLGGDGRTVTPNPAIPDQVGNPSG